MEPLNNNNMVHIILKVRFSDGSYASLSHLQTVNKSMFTELLDVFNSYLDVKAEDYSDENISEIIFQYHISYKKGINPIKTRLIKSINISKNKSFTFRGYKLPISTDIKDLNKWGTIISKTRNKLEIAKKASKLTYHITKQLNKHIVQLKVDNKLIFEFIDIIDSNHTSFSRLIRNQEFIFKNGQLVLKKNN
jgi:hypothetical protein